MEKRAIIAAMLMAGLLMVYQFLFVQPEPRQPPPGRTENGGTGPTRPDRATGWGWGARRSPRLPLRRGRVQRSGRRSWKRRCTAR